jgi:hypothetical protein
MAGATRVDAQTFEMPQSLAECAWLRRHGRRDPLDRTQ